MDDVDSSFNRGNVFVAVGMTHSTPYTASIYHGVSAAINIYPPLLFKF